MIFYFIKGTEQSKDWAKVKITTKDITDVEWYLDRWNGYKQVNKKKYTAFRQAKGEKE